jgi:hypothetical protein
MIDEPSTDEVKDVYAHFGLAYYSSSVLEHEIANAIFTLELLEARVGVKTQEEWGAVVDTHFEESFEKTLGKLKTRLAGHQQRSLTLASVMPYLERCVAERNFLAHHFWRESAAQWFTRKGREFMVQRLEKARELFSETDKKLEAAIQPFAHRFGFTAELERRELELIKREAREA